MKFIYITFAIIAAALAAVGLFLYFDAEKNENIASFEECLRFGHAILESYPRQCRTADGKNFVENIGNELEKMNLIRVTNPRPNQKIKSPLEIAGQARGYWFFEASFPVQLIDENGDTLRSDIATAQEEWMTENFVPFRVEIDFAKPPTKTGALILNRDNPSGLPENDDALIIPIIFEDYEE